VKIAIVGGAESAKDAPFDSDWLIWVLGNQLHRYKGKRIDRVFEIHEDLSEHNQGYAMWISNQDIELVVSDKFPISGDHISYFDYERASLLIGENFSSSPAVMMAQAIMDGATEIGIFGIEMAVDDHEYFLQRPCMEQWIGYAKGCGIAVHIPESSTLGKTTYREGRDWPNSKAPDYCASDFHDMAEKHKRLMAEAESKILELMPFERELEALRAKYQGHDGARQAYARLGKIDRAKRSGIDIDLKDGVKHG
jgi:hypothetical protein